MCYKVNYGVKKCIKDINKLVEILNCEQNIENVSFNCVIECGLLKYELLPFTTNVLVTEQSDMKCYELIIFFPGLSSEIKHQFNQVF